MRPRIAMEGRSFGRLTVLQELRSQIQGGKPRRMFLCLCECGNTSKVMGEPLRYGGTTSCGCYHRELQLEARKHGDAKSSVVRSEYRSWSCMIQRCENPANRAYVNYGGRGIMVCKKWRDSYAQFLSDMGRKPSLKYTIDRINNDGNYEPGNCRWATWKEQASNKRRKR